MKARVVAICAGVVVLVSAVVAPFVLEPRSPLERGDPAADLLRIRGLHEALIAGALELRLDLQPNYDSLVRTQDQLSQATLQLAQEFERVPEPYGAPLQRAFAPFEASVGRLQTLVDAFPRENATLNNSLRLLPRAYRRALAELGPEGTAGAPREERLEGILLGTLEGYASGDASRATAFLGRLEEIAKDHGGSAKAMSTFLAHARIVTGQKHRVDEILAEIAAPASRKDLEGTFHVLEDEVSSAEAATMRRRELLFASSLAIALVICGAVCVLVLRQNGALEREIQERIRADEDARRYELELRQAQKLESIGQMAAGIAHEINTPTQFVRDNVRFLDRGFADMSGLVDECLRLADPEGGKLGWEERRRRLERLTSDFDLDFLRAEVPTAIQQSLEGLDHVTNIVRAMRDFSHPGTGEKQALDVNASIRSSATVARAEYKHVAELELDLAPDLPPVPCYGGELNQVVLNMIVNAAHAIAEKIGQDPGRLGHIRITTRPAGDVAEIRIEDDGAGIPDEIRGRIFDPFFTTKEVGKGTGQGLSIAHGLVVKKLGGSIEVDSVPGAGSTFLLRLPVESGLRRPAAA